MGSKFFFTATPSCGQGGLPVLDHVLPPGLREGRLSGRPAAVRDGVHVLHQCHPHPVVQCGAPSVHLPLVCGTSSMPGISFFFFLKQSAPPAGLGEPGSPRFPSPQTGNLLPTGMLAFADMGRNPIMCRRPRGYTEKDGRSRGRCD